MKHMNHTVTSLIGFAAASALTLGALGQSNNNSSSNSSPGSSSNSQSSNNQSQNSQANGSQSSPQQQNPAGYVLIDERIVYLTANEPQNHMLRAHDAMMNKNNKVAASEVRIAADYLDAQASQVNQSSDSQLTNCADQLRQLAKQIDNGQNVDTQKLNDAFAKADARLADFYQSRAKEELNNKQYVRAGYDLRAGADGLSQAMVWSNQQPEKNAQQVIDNTQQVAWNLINESVGSAQNKKLSENPQPQSGTSKAEAQNISEHANGMVSALGKQIDQFNQDLQAQPASGKQNGSSSNNNSNDKNGGGNK